MTLIPTDPGGTQGRDAESDHGRGRDPLGWLVLVLLGALVLLASAFPSGCAAPPAATVEAPDWLVLSEDLSNGAVLWLNEARAAGLERPFVVAVHGAQFGDTWMAVPDWPASSMPVRQLALLAKRFHPGRPIVLLTCNPAGGDLDVPGVWYAKGDVWTRPAWGSRHGIKGVGNFDGFEVGREAAPAASRPSTRAGPSS